ncbi:MAG: IclR family transcriptional regulator [Micrococcales bacterium]|nr:IclR family transcriptional regulator [Micrococcales bacterium]
MTPNNQPPARNLTVDRALRVLEAFLGEERQLGVGELARQLDLDKSVIHRILTTLVGRRFIEQDPVTRRYQIGLRAWELGQRYRAGHRLRDLAHAELVGITHQHPYTTGYLSILDGADAVVLTTVRGPGPINLYIDPVTRMVAELTTTGRVLLAWLPAAQMTEVVTQRRSLGQGEWPYLTFDELADKLATIRASGFGDNRRGPSPPGVGTVAVAIRGNDGRAMAALTIDFLSGPETVQLWEALPSELAASAARIEQAINTARSHGTADQGGTP